MPLAKTTMMLVVIVLLVGFTAATLYFYFFYPPKPGGHPEESGATEQKPAETSQRSTPQPAEPPDLYQVEFVQDYRDMLLFAESGAWEYNDSELAGRGIVKEIKFQVIGEERIDWGLGERPALKISFTASARGAGGSTPLYSMVVWMDKEMGMFVWVKTPDGKVIKEQSAVVKTVAPLLEDLGICIRLYTDVLGMLTVPEYYKDILNSTQYLGSEQMVIGGQSYAVHKYRLTFNEDTKIDVIDAWILIADGKGLFVRIYAEYSDGSWEDSRISAFTRK